MAKKPADNPQDLSPLAQKLMWFQDEKNVKRATLLFFIACALLFVADFFYKKKTYLEIEAFPASYAIFGFVTCLALVFFGWVVRFLLMRQESYYAPEGVDAEDYPQKETGQGSLHD